MPGNENRATDWDRGPAEKTSETRVTKCNSEDSHSAPKNQVVTIAQHRERVFWQTFQLAVKVDLIERTAESKLLRTLAFRAWREVYVGAP